MPSMASRDASSSIKTNFSSFLSVAQTLQLLEGEEKEVLNLFQKISLDERHHDIQIIESNFTPTRVFDDWSMAFHDYGQNGLSANLKFGQIDSFLQRSGAFNKSSRTVLKFFGSVKDVLFTS